MEERKILDSWKEISGYLSRSVMTCQRWEKQLDLPIHRLDGTPRARVFAYPEELDRWLAEKLHSREAQAEIRRARARGAWRLAAMATAAVLVLGAVGGLAWRFYFHPIVPAPAQVPVLAVLPFENGTGDSAWDAWKLALPDLLTIDLRQSKFLDVVKTTSIFQAVGRLAESDKLSPADLKVLADKGQIDHVLSGSFRKEGGKIVIAGVLRDARTGQVTGNVATSCRAEDRIFAAADDLSKAVRKAMNLSPRQVRGDFDKPVARITTTSPQAFRSMSEAYRAQGRGRDGAGKFEDAIAPLLKAVELDPEFGLAYRYLHYSCRAMDRAEEAKKYGQLAVRWAGRIEERERHLFLNDYFDSGEPNKAKSLEALENLKAHYPYELTNLGLSAFYASQEEWDRAIPVLETLILRYPRRLSVVQPLFNCYRAVGRYAEAEKLLEERLGPSVEGRDTASYLSLRYRLALSLNRFDVADDSVERLKALDQDLASFSSNRGFISFMRDDLPNAERMYRQMTERDDRRSQTNGFVFLSTVSLSRGRIDEAKERILRAIALAQRRNEYEAPMEKSYRQFLAYLERAKGRLPEALKEIDRAYAAGPNEGLFMVVPVLYLKALITVEMGRLDEFEKQVEEIRKYLEPDRFPRGAPRYMRVYHNLLGHRELQKKNYPAAIRYFWKALDLLSPLAAQSIDDDHARYYFDLAEAYRLSGNSFNAAPFYEKVALPTVSREFSGDLYAKSFYWLGVTSEMQMRATGSPGLARERRQNAIGHYRKFLGLWGEADPIFPEVADARTRLAALEAR